MWFTKKLTVPTSNDTKQVDAIQLWEVRWLSRHGAYFGDTQKEVEAFPSESQAKDFADALESAFKLIRHSSGNKVIIQKSKEV